MTYEYETFAAANAEYVKGFGGKGELALPPARKLAIGEDKSLIVNIETAKSQSSVNIRVVLTPDSSPAASLGIKEGDAHVIRNAGGIAKEAIRSIIISQQLLGTREIALFHHTDCGMLTFTDAELKSKLKDQYPSSEAEINKFDFYPFPQLEQSVKEDITFLKNHPLVLDGTKITGWVYEVETGKVRQIV